MNALRLAPLLVWGWVLLTLLLPGGAAAQQPPAAEKVELRVFRLKYAAVPEVARVLRELFGSQAGPKGSIRLGIDDRTNSLIVSGKINDLMTVETVLQQIDSQGDPSPVRKAEPSADFQVRVFWLVSNPDRKDAPALSGDLKEAGAELGKMGIDKLRFATQVLAGSGARFEMSSAAQTDGPYKFSFSGTATDRKGAVSLDLTISANRQSGSLVSLRTSVTVPLGRPVVLAVTPTETGASAFVVRIERKEPSRQTAKRSAFEFRDVPWKTVLAWLSDQAGIPVVSNYTPTGTFTFKAPQTGKSYTLPEVIDILNEALQSHPIQKYLLIRRPNSLVLVPADERIDPALAVSVRPEDLEKYGKTEWVSVTIPLQARKAEEVAADVRKMLGPFGEAAVLKASNRLVVRDTAENLRRIYPLIADVERQGGKR